MLINDSTRSVGRGPPPPPPPSSSSPQSPPRKTTIRCTRQTCGRPDGRTTGTIDPAADEKNLAVN